jgi:hypothetical protein
MSLAELLRAKSSEYELLAEWHGERAPLDEDHLAACQAMLAVGIALREVAEALEVGLGKGGRCPLRYVGVPSVGRSLRFSSSRSSPRGFRPSSSSVCAWRPRSSTCASPTSSLPRWTPFFAGGATEVGARDFYLEVVLLALAERLDQAFPEFGWRRDRDAGSRRMRSTRIAAWACAPSVSWRTDLRRAGSSSTGARRRFGLLT